MQYLLATKRLNFIALVFNTSHERVNRWHRVLGRISYYFILIHGLLYLNYYIQVGGLASAFFRSVPVLGMIGLLSMTLLSTTTLSSIRKYHYRVFFIVHIFVALAIPPIIWFHVEHARIFLVISIIIMLADLGVRRLGLVRAVAKVETIPNTYLIKIVATIPPEVVQQFAANPALHAFLSFPRRTATCASQQHFSLSDIFTGLLSNPFTTASVNQETGELVFVARQMSGPMTSTLARLTSLQSVGSTTAIDIEGPYGIAPKFDNLTGSSFDTVVLVAGGVGATFIAPLYERIITKNPSARVRLIWVVRNEADFSMPIFAAGSSVYEDERVHLFLTADTEQTTSGRGDILKGNDDVELNHLELNTSLSSTRVPVDNRKRPNFKAFMDEVFRESSEGVAVVVCGPASMARNVRSAMGDWVKLGREVWFHNERFEW